jgi:excisionase family DNA binding protein
MTHIENFDEPVIRLTLSIRETAKILGVGRDTAYAAARAGKIPVLKFGKRMRVPRIALMRMLGEE